MNTRGKPRGYMLLEAMMAGSMTAIAVLGVMTLLADGRVRSIGAARTATAQELVSQQLEAARVLGFAGAAASPPAVVPGLAGKYTREVVVVGGADTLVGSESSNYKDVTVSVTFNDGAVTRTRQATVRLYE